MALLGTLIRGARTERKMTAQQLAQRAGISRGLLQRIEKGDMKCEVGVVFEVAWLVGIKLFDSDEPGLARLEHQARERVALLPKRVHKRAGSVDDDF